ncbi:unnamed protein product [Eruca vesicaria subsp. sativa]|uniref:Uncharacterized protein n=1 Tax=Eruca vesicaria subsp. sativa TaxID=29727 RepID=A0ABC8MAM5_ERUVS|nr:unnamed protein product [Eruca vesicaria subsp. sativa]
MLNIVALFEFKATIDDFVHGSPCNYISCGGCNSKAIKEPISLICTNKKCEGNEVAGVPHRLCGDAGKELTRKHASELVANSFECNGVGHDECVPVPQALLDAIGQTRRFIVKVSDHNFTGKIHAVTATKILPPEAPRPVAGLEGEGIPAITGDVLKTGSDESGPSSGFEYSGGDKIRKASESIGTEEVKRSKSG